MKTVALLHTVRNVVDSFGPELSRFLGGNVKIYNMLDEFLSIEPNETGVFTENNRLRLREDIRNLERTGADLIAATCSTLTPYLPEIRKEIGVPVIAVDDAMAERAVSVGGSILVLATAPSTIRITAEKVRDEARKKGADVIVDQKVVPEAFEALKQIGRERHDELLLAAAKEIRGYDCIVLAQASMAHLAEQIRSITGIETLWSPPLCMEQISEVLSEAGEEKL